MAGSVQARLPVEPEVELARARADLEALTGAIRHDLRAPLRAIIGFAEALCEDCGDRLGPDGAAYAERIVAAARSLDQLVVDLAAYCRLGSQPLTLGAVAVADAVADALTAIDDQQLVASAAVEVAGDLPRVRAHAPTLAKALAQLIDNALRYRKPDVAPRVRVYATGGMGPQTVRVWVEDNGIGIPPEHHADIFGVFERLHGVEHYPGTGIGLALVRRGVERMGGAAGVESVPGEGSRFWIELPAAP
ncbi:MAG: hypothetical protein D6689_14580 [Deltaproteobacteria bacterium]|nr:MAG: hypothetical protein D6689_14580 [Deltaproteobacteria bacterium]